MSAVAPVFAPPSVSVQLEGTGRIVVLGAPFDLCMYVIDCKYKNDLLHTWRFFWRPQELDVDVWLWAGDLGHWVTSGREVRSTGFFYICPGQRWEQFSC